MHDDDEEHTKGFFRISNLGLFHRAASLSTTAPPLPFPSGRAFFWRPLTINGVIAGSTIASYIGPLLITNFVNFLTTKNDKSSHYHELILALIFFLAKTVESLSQRQWSFGAHSTLSGYPSTCSPYGCKTLL